MRKKQTILLIQNDYIFDVLKNNISYIYKIIHLQNQIDEGTFVWSMYGNAVPSSFFLSIVQIRTFEQKEFSIKVIQLRTLKTLCRRKAVHTLEHAWARVWPAIVHPELRKFDWIWYFSSENKVHMHILVHNCTALCFGHIFASPSCCRLGNSDDLPERANKCTVALQTRALHAQTCQYVWYVQHIYSCACAESSLLPSLPYDRDQNGILLRVNQFSSRLIIREYRLLHRKLLINVRRILSETMF